MPLDIRIVAGIQRTRGDMVNIMMWFEKLVGFREETPEQVRKNLTVDGNVLRSRVNRREFKCGELETPLLAELKERAEVVADRTGRISVREAVADVQQLHLDPSNTNALFQVASQFNLLEMVCPQYTPEQGVAIYENDGTQGPACAIAAGAGTIYRNYFANVNGQIGQSATNQIDCLADLGIALGNQDSRLWEMKNGYALASESGLDEISNRLRSAGETEFNDLGQLLRVGVHWDTQVTLDHSDHIVSQVYCSALPVAYLPYSSTHWEAFAKLVLNASYEAAFCSAILNQAKTGNNRLFLTLLGGGAFGNNDGWIVGAIRRALQLFADTDLDVVIVSRRSSQYSVRQIVNEFST